MRRRLRRRVVFFRGLRCGGGSAPGGFRRCCDSGGKLAGGGSPCVGDASAAAACAAERLLIDEVVPPSADGCCCGARAAAVVLALLWAVRAGLLLLLFGHIPACAGGSRGAGGGQPVPGCSAPAAAAGRLLPGSRFSGSAGFTTALAGAVVLWRGRRRDAARLLAVVVAQRLRSCGPMPRAGFGSGSVALAAGWVSWCGFRWSMMACWSKVLSRGGTTTCCLSASACCHHVRDVSPARFVPRARRRRLKDMHRATANPAKPSLPLFFAAPARFGHSPQLPPPLSLPNLLSKWPPLDAPSSRPGSSRRCAQSSLSRDPSSDARSCAAAPAKQPLRDRLHQDRRRI